MIPLTFFEFPGDSQSSGVTKKNRFKEQQNIIAVNDMTIKTVQHAVVTFDIIGSFVHGKCRKRYRLQTSVNPVKETPRETTSSKKNSKTGFPEKMFLG